MHAALAAPSFAKPACGRSSFSKVGRGAPALRAPSKGFAVFATAEKSKPSESHHTFDGRLDGRGDCDLKEAKFAKEACKGLEGKNLEDCYATFGCDVEAVTDHYTAVAGIKKGKDGKDGKET
eukprot:CAMPEP_0182867926 /NCGR_PEP_ID=MMETSP0034_2-20130328/9013_1 /TAXON_ID=156128 /ORGANISM="Nephroselmis pyriformis, Strain CCMP717" /LENGTH=121 /DNA_ID=CAMNT_0025000313 /DNA_START=67 /DNA_END=432 /DNA_ORIENTATION=-